MIDPAFWDQMRAFTQARIGLGRAGTAMPTAALLDFERSAALAREAVHAEFDPQAIEAAADGYSCLRVASRAPDRATFLKRPDLGRQLTEDSVETLRAAAGEPYDLVFVIADGLSARASDSYAVDVLRPCLAGLADFRIGPLVLASQARVALADEIAETLSARAVAILLGERPGLAVANSLGFYFTWAPKVGTPDSGRNCISNIHDTGLSPAVAAKTALWLIREASRLRVSGVTLKENADGGELVGPSAALDRYRS